MGKTKQNLWTKFGGKEFFARMAENAKNDGEGNEISKTYATKDAATTSAPGLMSADDKAKLDGIAAGAQVNTIQTISANGTDLTIDNNKNVDIPLATSEVDGLLPHGKFPLIPPAPDGADGPDQVYSFDEPNGMSWQTIVKDYLGNMVLDQQGNPVTGEDGSPVFSEDSIRLWLSYKGTEFGARRAYDDHTGANIHDSIEARTTLAQVTAAIESALANYGGFRVVTLTSDDSPVPDVAEPSTRFIYLTRETPSTKEDPYTEWIWVEPDEGVAHWEKIGETSIDVDNFAHKVTGGTPGNIPALDQNGDLVDSGVSASAVSTAVQDVKIGNSSLKDANNVATIPMFNSTTDGVVTAPTEGNRNAVSFLNGMGDWSMMDEVSEGDINDIFVDGVRVGDRKYPYVQIGNQLWTTKNLDWKFDGIRLNPDDNGWTGYSAWYYDRDEQTYGLDGTYKCGLLYTYMSAVYIDSLLTDGWRVPTDSDFQTLIDNYQATDLLAEADSITTGFPNTTWGGTNSTGLSLLPTGRVRDGSMNSFNSNTLTEYSIQSWTTSYVSRTDPIQAKYFAYNSYYYRLSNDSSRNNGYPIRLVKDVT